LNRELFVQGEQIDAELDNLIERRDRQRRQEEGDRLEEEAWKESTRRHNAKLKAEEGRTRLEWFKHLHSVYAARTDEYEQLIQEIERTY